MKKKKNYTKALLIASPAIALATLSACSDFDFEKAHGTSVVKELKTNYDASFAEAFGSFGVLNIDPQQNWGFNEMKSVEDYLGTFSTRAAHADPDANMWGGYIYVPAPLTDKQKQVVTDWFDVTRNPQGVAINFSDYFIQQVHKGTDHYTAHNGGDVLGSEHMDQLSDAMQHQFNHNGGDMSWNENVWDGTLKDPNDPNSKDFHRDQIMLIRESSTAYFQYHGTEDSQWHQDCYVIIPGEMIDPSNSLASEGQSIWGMYFVAFDFFENGANPNQQVDRDYFFDDWIVRITPGIFKNETPDNGGSGSSTGQGEEPQQLTARIMCEDLGTTDDFDFNDVVFDVTFTSSTNAYIVLRAAGGTMPLYIGNPNEGGQEVHELFGVPTNVMVNTNNGSVSKPVATFNLPVTSNDPNDIPVIVVNTRHASAISYVLDATPGVAPRKICVTPDVDWADERVNIQTIYPNFAQWILDHTFQFWDTPKALESATLNASIDKFNIMAGGEPANITYDTNSDGTVIIESSNPAVARVSGKQIIPVSAGTATISIYVPKTSNYVATGAVTFEVTVRENDGSSSTSGTSDYGQMVSGTYYSGMNINESYFTDASSKITLTFLCNTNELFSAQIVDKTGWHIQGQQQYGSPNNGVMQFVITENIEYAKDGGITCSFYNAMPTAVYVKSE